MPRKIKSLMMISLLLASSLLADPPVSNTVDVAGLSAPALVAYCRNVKSFVWTVKNTGTAVNGTPYTPIMYAISSNTASRATMIEATCSWQSVTGGTFIATFPSNTLTTAGYWIYGVGLKDSGTNVTIITQGRLSIRPDPF